MKGYERLALLIDDVLKGPKRGESDLRGAHDAGTGSQKDNKLQASNCAGSSRGGQNGDDGKISGVERGRWSFYVAEAREVKARTRTVVIGFQRLREISLLFNEQQ
jgi:hypothetical protein